METVTVLMTCHNKLSSNLKSNISLDAIQDIAETQTVMFLLSPPAMWEGPPGARKCLSGTHTPLLHPQKPRAQAGASRTDNKPKRIQILSSKNDRSVFLNRASIPPSQEFYLQSTWCRGKCAGAKSIIQCPESLLSTFQLPFVSFFFLDPSISLFWIHWCSSVRGAEEEKLMNMHEPICDFLELWFFFFF